MKFFKKCKDGGAESTVDAYVLVEIKSLFSIILLRFGKGSREAFHTHAFNAISWIIKGHSTEFKLDGSTRNFVPSLIPILTRREDFHKVYCHKDMWALTFRGPWQRTWQEYLEKEKRFRYLTHGRQEVEERT